MIDVFPASSTAVFARVRALLDEMGAWDAAATSALGFDGDELLRVCYSETVEQLLDTYTRPGAELHVALQAGEPSGCAGFNRMGGGDVELKKVFVRPDFRGEGIARALMEKVMTRMELNGYVRAKL